MDIAVPILFTCAFITFNLLKPFYRNAYKKREIDLIEEIKEEEENLLLDSGDISRDKNFEQTMLYQSAKLNHERDLDYHELLLSSAQLQAYVDIIQGDETDTKVNACIMLSKFQTVNSIKLLRLALQDDEYEVRYMANNALGKLEQELLSRIDILSENIEKYPNQLQNYLKRAHSYTSIVWLNLLDKSLSNLFLEKALSDFRHLLVKQPENFSLYTSIANCYLKLGLQEEMLLLASQAKKLNLEDEDIAKISFYEAEAFYELGQYDKVVQLCNMIKRTKTPIGLIKERSEYWAEVEIAE